MDEAANKNLADWTARPWPAPDRLTGTHVEVVRLDPDRHGQDLWTVLGGPENADLWTYIADGPFPQRADLEDWLTMLSNKTDWVPYALVVKPENQARGIANYMRIDTENGVAEVGCIVLGDGLARRPAATEALMLMIGHVLDDLGYRRFEWKCNADNRPSRRAADRLGFVYEGTFRQHQVVKSANRDTAWYAILDHEWPTIRAGADAWLSPDNFDDDGQQRRALAACRDNAAAGSKS